MMIYCCVPTIGFWVAIVVVVVSLGIRIVGDDENGELQTKNRAFPKNLNCTVLEFMVRSTNGTPPIKMLEYSWFDQWNTADKNVSFT
jgi:uncharacterized membrane protein